MNLAHIHILLNHFPTVGTIVTLGFFILALVMKSDDLKRASLTVFVGLGLVAIAAYVSGGAAEEQIKAMAGVSKDGIAAHKNAALLAFAILEITAMAAWFGLWQIRRIGRSTSMTNNLVLVFAIISLALMANAAEIGGEIRHPEILEAGATRSEEHTSELQSH